MAEILTNHEINQIRNRAHVGITSDVLALIASHRALAAERDNDVSNRQHCEDEVYELQQRLHVKTELLDKAMAQVCSENTAKVKLESRIRTLESACEAALKMVEEDVNHVLQFQRVLPERVVRRASRNC